MLLHWCERTVEIQHGFSPFAAADQLWLSIVKEGIALMHRITREGEVIHTFDIKLSHPLQCSGGMSWRRHVRIELFGGFVLNQLSLVVDVVSWWPLKLWGFRLLETRFVRHFRLKGGRTSWSSCPRLCEMLQQPLSIWLNMVRSGRNSHEFAFLLQCLLLQCLSALLEEGRLENVLNANVHHSIGWVKMCVSTRVSCSHQNW